MVVGDALVRWSARSAHGADLIDEGSLRLYGVRGRIVASFFNGPGGDEKCMPAERTI